MRAIQFHPGSFEHAFRLHLKAQFAGQTRGGVLYVPPPDHRFDVVLEQNAMLQVRKYAVGARWSTTAIEFLFPDDASRNSGIP